MTSTPVAALGAIPDSASVTGDRPAEARSNRFAARLGRSIVVKILAPVPIVMALALIVAWFTIPPMIRDNVRTDAIESARQTVNQFKAIRGYYTKNVIVKVVKSKALKPSYNHKGNPGAVPLPATLIHDMSALLGRQNTRISLYSAYPFPNRAKRKLDEFQKQAWAFLTKNPGGIFVRQQERGGKQVVRVAIADRMVAAGCVSCHNKRADTPKNDWKLGDVRGVLEVSRVVDSQLAAGNHLSMLILMGILACGVALLVLCLFAGNRISRPMAKLVAAMRNLANGDTAAEIPGTVRSDEVGAMARATEVFRENAVDKARLEAEQGEAALRAEEEKRAATRKIAENFSASVSAVVEGVASAATEMSASVETMSQTADATKGQAASVAAASEEATTNVQTVASAAEEMSSSVEEISRQVEQSTRIAQRAVEEAAKTNSSVEGLATAADKIGEVVSLISDIAEQTNLLALNATIEAARAGEAGKGFAVVANEVKSLAEQTAKATEDVTTQIAAIQTETGSAVGAIKGIGTTIAEVSEIATEIANAVEQQGAATGEIARNCQEAARGTQEVSGNIGKVSEAVAQNEQTAAQLREATGELSTQSERLRTEVDRFLAEMVES